MASVAKDSPRVYGDPVSPTVNTRVEGSQGDGMNKVDLKGKGTMELSGGILRLRWKHGACIGIDVAKAGLAAVSTLSQGARLPMFVEIQGVTHSAAARKVSPEASKISRMAILGSSPTDRVIAMFRLPFVPAGYPIRYFTSEDRAMAWLIEPSEDGGERLGNTP